VEQAPKQKVGRNIVMENNENLVTEKVAENVEQTTEQTQQAKTYTQEEVDAIVGKKKARLEAKIRKDYDRRYGGLMDVLKAGTGKEDVDEITDTFGKFYESKGIKINKKPEYSDRDLETLARADADEIIRSGYEEVVEEVDRLTELGAANMSAREKALFKVLAEHRQSAERGKELSSIGVTEDVYNSAEFKDFQSKFNANTPIKDIYDIYAKTQPKKQIQTMGSMKNTTAGNAAVKDFYSYEEAVKFTKSDFDKNPELLKAVEASMSKW
jgi:hypothetical protein